MTTKPAAEERFYETIGDELSGRVAPTIEGINMDGFFTPQQFVLISKAYEAYLHGGSAAESENGIQLENEITESPSEREQDEDEQRAY